MSERETDELKPGPTEKTTRDDDDGVINVLQSIINQSYPKGTIGYDYLSNAICHIRKMRKEIVRMKA